MARLLPAALGVAMGLLWLGLRQEPVFAVGGVDPGAASQEVSAEASAALSGTERSRAPDLASGAGPVAEAPAPRPQEASPSQTPVPGGPSSSDSPERSAFGEDPESRPLSLRRSGGAPASPPNAPSESLTSLMGNVVGKLVLVLALILACGAAWKRLRGALPPTASAPHDAVHVTSTVTLAPQRFLHVVTVGRQRLLVGSSPQSISLIARLDEGTRDEHASDPRAQSTLVLPSSVASPALNDAPLAASLSPPPAAPPTTGDPFGEFADWMRAFVEDGEAAPESNARPAATSPPAPGAFFRIASRPLEEGETPRRSRGPCPSLTAPWKRDEERDG